MSRYFLVEVLNELSKVTKQPLQQTQRIKFTSFDVSVNYLVFGATSGGIYVFHRHPCNFFKLVPGKEGAVSHIAISPDEKILAISTSRGLILLVNNWQGDSGLQCQIYAEHKGNSVTALKWQANDLYSGDSLGKVSVISITSILSKAIFQPPSATLMHLGSSIVQLDVHSKYLLASTKTKTFLCDTQDEKYRQIGKKLRDGDFGSCFYSEKPSNTAITRDREKTTFKAIKDGEKFASEASVEGVKIYCMRPGLRIWEANFEGGVVCTYQFREVAVAGKVVQLGAEENARLRVVKSFGGVKGTASFGRVEVVGGLFVVTFNSGGLYIFDAKTATLLHKYSLVDYVRDVRVVDGYIYVWDKNEFKILHLMNLEMLIMRTLAKKQYYLCAELCVKYTDELLKVLDKCSGLSILSDKVTDVDLLDKITPIIAQLTIKAKSAGVVTVDNGYLPEASCSYERTNLLCNKDFNNSPPKETNNQTDLEGNDPNYILNIMHKQYQVNKMYSNIEMPQIYEIFSQKSLSEIVEIFKSFIKHVNIINNDKNVESWCYFQYLKYVSIRFKNLDVDSEALAYIFEAFKSINSSEMNLTCDCTFPLPSTKNFKSKFYEIGCELCKKLSDTELKAFKKSIPYLWKNNITGNKDLPLLIQFSDIDLLNDYSKNLNSDNWEDMTNLLIKLKRNVCLNCEKKIKFDVKDTFHWKDFAGVMLKSLEPQAAMKILMRFAQYIPNKELGMEFYQICIFSALVKDTTKASDVIKGIKSVPDLYNEFDRGLVKYLNARYISTCPTPDPLGTSTTKNPPPLKCSSCDLPLKTPVLCSEVRLVCGHAFHKICVDRISRICCVCDVQKKLV